MSTTLSAAAEARPTQVAPAGTTTPNTVLSDLVSAIETYPTDFLTIEIFDIDPPGSGTAINEFEDVTFKVQVHNDGPLDVTDLTLLVEALPACEGVKLHGGAAFNPQLTTTAIDKVPAHQADGVSVITPDGHYHFKAGDADGGKVDLVRVSINTWNTNFDHPLIAHSDPVPSDNQLISANILRA